MKLSFQTKVCNCIYILGIAFIGIINYLDIEKSSPFIVFVLFIFIDALWISQVNRRIFHKKAKVYIISVGILGALFVFLKTVRILFFKDGSDISRILWYLYIIPQVYMVLMIFMSSLYIGKGSYYKLKKRFTILYVLAFLICFSIISNDYHHLAFTFSNGDYKYGVFYYISVMWVIILLSFVSMLTVRMLATDDNIKKIWMPFIPLVIAFVYFLLFLVNKENTFALCFKTADIFPITFMAYMEILIQTRFLVNNDNYSLLWKNSSLDSGIFDENFNLYFKTLHGKKISSENMLASIQDDVLLDDGKTLVRGSHLSIGYVYWCKDMSDINRINEELSELIDIVNDENSLIENENLLKKKKQTIESKKKLYDYISSDLNYELVKIENILNSLSLDETAFEDEIKLAGVYMAYIKRRSNLLLLSKNNRIISSLELDLAIKESIEYLAFYGFIVCFMHNGTCNMSCDNALAVYKFIQDVIENVLPIKGAIIVDIKYTTHIELKIEISAKDVDIKLIPTKFRYSCEKEDDTVYIKLLGDLYD